MVEENTINEQRIKVEELLDEYEKSVGINSYGVQSELELALNLTAYEIKKLTAEQCGEYAYVLAQGAFHVQKELNKENARIKWAKDKIDKVVSKSINQYGQYTDKDTKRNLAINDNQYALELKKIEDWAGLRAERLSYMSSRLVTMSDILKEQAKVKRRNEF